MFDLRKIFAVPKTFLKSKIHCACRPHNANLNSTSEQDVKQVPKESNRMVKTENDNVPIKANQKISSDQGS